VSRVVRVLWSPPTKTTYFEVKNRCKSEEEANTETFTAVILFFFDSNKRHLALEMNSTKL